MDIILASNSPRRKELLGKLNYQFTVQASNCSEVTTAQSPRDMAMELASRKAMDIFKKNPQSIVIGADTIVAYNSQVFGKPATEEQAKDMLVALSGNVHDVHTGVCIACPLGVWLFCETTHVTFKQLSAQQIEEYVASGSPMDKAGAYGIQDSGFVQQIDGDYDNVVGFPSSAVNDVLQQIYKR